MLAIEEVGVESLVGFIQPQACEKPWMKECKFILGTPDNIGEIMNQCIESGRFGLDLETSGLDNRVINGMTVDHIAGVCIAPFKDTTYYIPLTHVSVAMDGTRTPSPYNVPWNLFAEAFKKLLAAIDEKKTVAVFHNGKFDQEFLQFNGKDTLGEWDKTSAWDDTLILAYLRNPRARVKGLKDVSAAPTDAGPESQTGGPGLGMEMIELVDLWPPEHKGDFDFTTLDPSRQDVLWYAGSDALCTLRLYDVLSPAVFDLDSDHKNQKTIYTIEKACVAATRWMERNRIHVDTKVITELIAVGQQEWFDSIMDVYTEASRILGRDVMPGKYHILKEIFKADDPHYLLDAQLEVAESRSKATWPDSQMKILGAQGKEWPPIYDVNSPVQLGLMFEEMSVPGLKRTEKSGQVKTSKDELDRVIEEAGASFPFMGKVKRFREVSKALSSYLQPMLTDCDPESHLIRINFQGHKVDTGRFSTPSRDNARNKMQGWPTINLQGLPSTYDPNRPECMARIRECITGRRPDKYLVAIDYSGVELRLVTNLSREPLWLKEFFHCSSCGRMFDQGVPNSPPPPPPIRCPNCGGDKIGDLHTLTALSIYGAEAQSRADWKQLRANAKACNFAMCYGGGGSAAQRATGVDKNEGWRIKRAFDKTYVRLEKWWGEQHKFAHQHSFIRTAFGRRYPVPDINSPDERFRSKAERNSVNGPVQGSSADLTKIAMALIYKECKNRGWLEKAQMVITIHDELVFEIDGDILEEAIEVLLPIMTRNPYVQAMNWPIPFICDVEIGHSWMVPWDLNAMRYREVRFNGNKKVKEPKEPDPEKFDTVEAYEKAKAEYPAKHAAWEALPSSWPEELAPLFKMKVPLEKEISLTERPVEIPSAPVVAEVQEPVPVEEAPAPEGTPFLFHPEYKELWKEKTSKGIFEYQIQEDLTSGLIDRLGTVLNTCYGGGTQVLHLIDSQGQEIPLEEWFEGPVRINGVAFLTGAQILGIQGREVN